MVGRTIRPWCADATLEVHPFLAEALCFWICIIPHPKANFWIKRKLQNPMHGQFHNLGMYPPKMNYKNRTKSRRFFFFFWLRSTFFTKKKKTKKQGNNNVNQDRRKVLPRSYLSRFSEPWERRDNTSRSTFPSFFCACRLWSSRVVLVYLVCFVCFCACGACAEVRLSRCIHPGHFRV